MIKTIAEIGINHNGSLDIAKQLINIAGTAGVDYVKFQKRNPDKCVPESQKNLMRETPWGDMTYYEYKQRIEFGEREYEEIDAYCRGTGIEWFVSVWDADSMETPIMFDNRYVKVPSACITDKELLWDIARTNIPVILSTGMADMGMVDSAMQILGSRVACVMHCVSTYPSRADEQNLKCIRTLKEAYPGIPVGFSNHFPGITFIPVAVALGAEFIEFHITLDRSMWGTDQASSIEPEGVYKIMKYIRNIEQGMGDGNKRIMERELPIMERLRRY